MCIFIELAEILLIIILVIVISRLNDYESSYFGENRAMRIGAFGENKANKAGFKSPDLLGYFGENKANKAGFKSPEIRGYYTTQADILAKPTVGFFKDAAELS
jgi:hypothetical protein